MDWLAYCISKKIDSDKFSSEEPEKWTELKNIFEQVHPKSFTEQKKFLINDLRRKYLLVVKVADQNPAMEKPLKPIVKIIPKKSGGD